MKCRTEEDNTLSEIDESATIVQSDSDDEFPLPKDFDAENARQQLLNFRDCTKLVLR